MAQVSAQAKQAKGSKAVERSARFRARNAASRATKIARTRARKIKRATQSCGKVFAANLATFYALNPASSLPPKCH